MDGKLTFANNITLSITNYLTNNDIKKKQEYD